MTPHGLLPLLATPGFWEVATLAVSAMAAVVTAMLAVTRRNPLYGAFCLIVFFICIAILYFRLAAPFVGILQILIYAGAIMVLYTFIIMLLDLTPRQEQEERPPPGVALAMPDEPIFRFGPFMLSFILFLALAIPVVLAANRGFFLQELPAVSEDFGTAEMVGREIFTTYALPFEMVGLLLLVAVVVAVVLSKRQIADKAEDTEGMGRGLAT